ncbi:MAG: MBL fold metallo-hydrolase [bacterium]
MAAPTRITIPLPFPLRTANAWVFPGRGADATGLVDCGIGTRDGYAALREGLGDSGADANGLHLVVTHGHVDHAGNAARLRREFGATLWAPKEESRFVETFCKDAPRRLDAFATALTAHGAPPDVVAVMRLEGAAMDGFLEDCPIGHDVRSRERIQLGETKATAFHAPGHTPGSLVILTDDNQLLSGDTLLEHITSNAIELLDADRGRYGQYLRTLRSLRAFVGCDVLPGHHEPFTLTDSLLDVHLAKHEKRGRKILEHLDRPKTAWQLLPEVLPHLAHDQRFLGMCEVVGHLHLLELEGRAAWSEQDGARRFRRV